MSTAVAAPPRATVLDNREHRIRHVHPCLPWFDQAVLNTMGLWRYYRLNDTSGTSAVDSAGNAQHGTYVNTPALAQAGLWTPDDASNAAVGFTAASSHRVTVPNWNLQSSVNPEAISIEAIVNVTSLSARRAIFSIHGGAAADQIIYLAVTTSGQIGLLFQSDDLLSATGVIQTGVTYHVVATNYPAVDQSRIYVNGVLVASGSQGPYAGSSTPTVQIGAWNSAEHFDGKIDEVAIYRRPLTATEVVKHAEAAGLMATSSVNGGAVRRSSRSLLGKAYTAETVPVGTLPSSPDLVQGSYTLRRDDAGEFTLAFPNSLASDGIKWRERFATEGHLEFLEIYRGDDLEFVGSIQRVGVGRTQVEVSGQDAWSLLRKGYELDRNITDSAADVLRDYTRVPRVIYADDFTTDRQIALRHDSVGSFSFGPTGLVFSENNVNVPLPAGFGAKDSWDIVATGRAGDETPVGGTYRLDLSLLPKVDFAAGDAFVNVKILAGFVGTSIQVAGASSSFGNGTATIDRTINFSNRITEHSVRISRRGRYLYIYADGYLVTIFNVPGNAAQLEICRFNLDGWLTLMSVTVNEPLLRADTSDRVVPGSLPTGGLHGRYWNQQSLEGYNATVRRDQNLTPLVEPYHERHDPRITTDAADGAPRLTIPPQPGASGSYFTARWFGAVYLRGDLGDYSFRVSILDDGCRLWVGKTAWGDQLIDDWVDSGSHTAGPATLDSTVFGDQAGWVPIVLDYHEGAGTGTLKLQFTPPGSGTYVDPGGTTITRGSLQVIPATSLSPLGCFDQRIQGTSHFDIVQQAAQGLGYQLWCQPMQLESGEFPGRLAAKVRYGRDTDIILRGEDEDPIDVLLGPGVETDASDIATTLRGVGAGLSDRRGQVAVDVVDHQAAEAALFNLTAIDDAPDVSFPDLLRGRLDAGLALRSAPWQNVTGAPRAQNRLADTFPLTGAYALMRWLPGDAVRLQDPLVGLDDASPRQIVQVTREILAGGRIGTQIGFRQRPKSVAATLRRLSRVGISGHRNYQRQKTTLNGYIEAGALPAGTFSAFLLFALLPQDDVMEGRFRITANSANVPVGLEINGTSRTTELGGSWTKVPVDIDITAYVAPASTTDNRVFFRLANNGGVASNIGGQAEIDVLR